MQRVLIILGLIILGVGLLYPFLGRLGLGSLPGDFHIKGERFSFHFPLATCLLISLILSAILWLWRRFQ